MAEKVKRGRANHIARFAERFGLSGPDFKRNVASDIYSPVGFRRMIRDDLQYMADQLVTVALYVEQESQTPERGQHMAAELRAISRAVSSAVAEIARREES